MEQELQRITDWIGGQAQRVIIGISGHGASGKTTLARELIRRLGQENINVLNTDPYIIGSDLRKYAKIEYEYGGEHYRDKMTACHPSAHHVTALERDIRMLRDGLELYSIGTHYAGSTRLTPDRRINIVEGMSVAFTDPALYDLSIYLYTDGGTELERRGVRDVAERGTELAYLLKSHEQRRIQYELFMHPYHENFDIVIRNQP